MWKLCGWLLFVGSAGDVVSSELMLRTPGVYEANPLQRDRWVRVSSHVVTPALALWGTNKLRRRHPRWAWALRIGAIAGWGYVTVHNLRLARGPP